MSDRFDINRVSRQLKLGAVHLRDRWLLRDGALAGAGRWPVRARSGGAMRPPFFVLGHPRSGTTLLRAMLSRHPDVFIPPENDALWRMIRLFGDRRGAPWEVVATALAEGMRSGYEFAHWGLQPSEIEARILALPDEQRSLQEALRAVYFAYAERHCSEKQVWGDKTTPGSFDYLGKVAIVFPQARYIHILRDGRDCVVSSVKAGFFNRDYVEAATAWRDNVRALSRFGERWRDGRAMLKIRYEDLVSEPQPLLAGLCEHIGVSFSPAMVEHHVEAAAAVPELSAVSHHHNVGRPVFTQSIGKWNTALPDAVRAQVLDILGPELATHGYQ